MQHKQKSNTFAQRKVRTPGGRVAIQYKGRKPGIAKCGSCKGKLNGIPRGRPADMQALAKTEKRPQRPYGGVLCSYCMREKIKAATRQ